MPITGNTSLLYLYRQKIITKELYTWMNFHRVSSIDIALTYLLKKELPEELKHELYRFKKVESDKVLALNTDNIKELEEEGFISKQLCKFLLELDVHTIGQIKRKDFFSKVKYSGLKNDTELRYVLSIFENIENSEISNDVNCFDKTNSHKGNGITLSTKISTLYHKERISVRLYHCLDYEGFSTLGDVADYIENVGSIYKLLNIRNFGMKCLIELQELLANVSSDSIEEIQQPSSDNEPELSSKDCFFIKYNELITNDIYKSAIDYYYGSSKSKLSARTIHIIDANFKSFVEVLNLYFTGVEISYLRNCGKKTYEELNLFAKNLFDYISSLFMQDNEDSEFSLLRNTYPFLSEAEIDFVFKFQKKMSHPPMFYVLYHYLTKSNSRFERIFCRYYGLGREPEILTEISASLNITRERCRQLIATKRIKDKTLISSDEWSRYNFFNDILLYNDYDFKNLLINEGLEHLSMFSFMGLCSLVKEVRTYSLGRNSQKKYYISENFFRCFDLKNSIKDIESTLNKRCTASISLPISVFIDSYWLDEPPFERSKVEDIIIHILKEDYGISIGEDRLLHVQQNALDRSEEIYKIIEEYGKPMHLNLICDVLKSRYPELSDMTIEQVRSYTFKHPGIQAIGKSSTYAIDKWELYTGTIRDLLYDILVKENEPMHIDKLYNEVSLIYPNTSIKSITASMVSEESQRFVRFVGSYYGVVGKLYNEEYVIWEVEAFSRKNFEERIEEFEAFLKSHHHLPRADREDEKESSLYRWYRRVKASDAPLTVEQQERLSELLEKNKDYLVTATEYSFYRYCEDFKAFIEDNMDFPTIATDPAKYYWVMKNKKIYKDFDDRRKIYFEGLIDFLYTYGFEI